METEEKYFSFVVKTEFQDSHHRFDQCGIVMYLDSENWLKGSIEYENEQYQHLGSVVTNNGYSARCESAICLKEQTRFSLVFMPAHRKSLLSKPYSVTWKCKNASGCPMMDSSRMRSKKKAR